MNTRPESDQSTIDIAQIEGIFPAPPKSIQTNGKALPPLPSLAEIESGAAEATAAALADEHDVVTNTSASNTLYLARRWPEKLCPVSIGISTSQRPMMASSNGLRPPTASTKTSSFESNDTKRTLKYGTGKHAMVELSPQPSEDPADPLNWPLWKKNINFLVLLTLAAIMGAMKTSLLSFHGELAEEYNVDYTTAAALTGVPLMVSSVSGMSSTILAKIWGKRPVYLISTLLVFIGSAWDINTKGDYAQHMAARVIQGLGWGSFDALVLGSILDTFFEHERIMKVLMYNVVLIASTWGSPVISGAVSARPGGFSIQFSIFTSFLVVLMPVVIMAVPETAYIRSGLDDNTFPMLTRSQSNIPKIKLTKSAVLQATVVDRAILTQGFRAAVAPSTILFLVITMIPYVALWAFSSSLSMLFATTRASGINASSIGLLFLAPFSLGTAAAVGLRWALLHRISLSRTIHLVTVGIGTAFSSAGILGFGLYVSDSMRGATWDQVSADNIFNFRIISFLLGLLALGSASLDTIIDPVIQQSTAFTSANMAVALRNIADMHAGLTCLRHLVAGAFVLGLPGVMQTVEGLRASAVGMAVVYIFITIVIAAVSFMFGRTIKSWDGIVMGLVDLSGLKHRSSFFDTD
ncbi:hypothetical protein GGS20DRAFT_574511 [Poronia punctata]|nr:hypothetical protein GGS20DRAFT_574511 [Poronia punctata]